VFGVRGAIRALLPTKLRGTSQTPFAFFLPVSIQRYFFEYRIMKLSLGGNHVAQADGLTNQEENAFWLQIFIDEADMIAYSLEQQQTDEISQSKQFSSRFYKLYEQARGNLLEDQINKLNNDALQVTKEFRQFIFEIFRRQLFEKFYINLLPVFVNNILNLANMYLYMLREFLQKKKPQFEATHFLGFWLPIIIPNIAQIENNVGLYFYEFKTKMHDFSSAFDKDLVRINIDSSVMENGMPEFPINRQIILEVYNRLSSYAEFHLETMIMVEKKKLPTSLSRIYLDHFYRMLCYIVTELTYILKMKKPVCDPGYPRLSLFDRYTID
jgi:hypothetical protein